MGLFDQAAPQAGLYGGGQQALPPMIPTAPQAQGAAPNYMAVLAALLQKLGLVPPNLAGANPGGVPGQALRPQMPQQPLMQPQAPPFPRVG